MSNDIEDDAYSEEGKILVEDEDEDEYEYEEKIIKAKRMKKKKVVEVDEKKLFHEFQAYALQVWYIFLFRVISQKNYSHNINRFHFFLNTKSRIKKARVRVSNVMNCRMK